MRSIALILAALLASAPAVAQSWQEYSYSDYAFSVAFPSNPQIETTTHQSQTAVRSRRASIRFAKTTSFSK